MHSVMLLITSFGALAGLYVLLDAPFTAVTQIIIYAGAIMVLFLFVVMLLNVPREEPVPRAAAGTARADRACRIGAVLSVLLGGRDGLGAVAARADLVRAGRRGRDRRLGRADRHALFTDHAFAFEATSILILVAMVGAVVLARKEH